MDTFKKKTRYLDLGSPQFRGGVVTNRPAALIPIGSYSVLQNVRPFHPGFRKRDGQTKLHTTTQLNPRVVSVPAYNAGSTTYAMGYSAKTAATWAGARDAAAGDNATISTEHNNSCIVFESGGNFTVGRSILFFDLSRIAGTVSSASLYIKLRNGTNLGSVIVKKWTGTDPDLNDSGDPFAAGDFDAFSGDYSAAVDLSSGGAADTWMEIPLDAGSPDTAVTDLNAAIGNTDTTAIFAVVVTEYTYDDQDTEIAAATTSDCNFYIGTAANRPYLSLTMSTPEEIVKLYQWSKGKVSEKHLFAQLEGGDLLESTDSPPTVTTGDFGSLVRQPRIKDSARSPLPVLNVGYDQMVPASFTSLRDILLYSDGISPHNVYTGQTRPVDSFVKVLGTSTLADNPEVGFDYSFQVSDNDPDTAAILDSLGDLANDYDAFFIKTDFKAEQFNFTIKKPNGTSGTLKMKTWQSDNGWEDQTITDGTADGGAPLAVDGSVTWTPDANEIEFYAFGENGYWYMFYMDDGDSLDAEVEISEVTYQGEWQTIDNVWNGVLLTAIEAYHWDNSAGIYFSYTGTGIDLGGFEHSSDYLYISTTDNVVGLHFNFGSTPNTNTTTVVSQVDGWDGDSWVDMAETDNTSGFNDSGFITWKRNANIMKREFNGSAYKAYWWRITLGTASCSDETTVTIRSMPWFDITDWGAFGNVSTAWKERAVYTFDRNPSWLYVTENARPNVLNGSDYATLQAGDGRQNAIIAMAKFHNELIVWQEEKGRDGGCVTLFEGYSPSTFGKLLLSAKIGSFSQKSVVVIDGANSHTKRDNNQQTLAFFISHYGIFVTDGSIVTRISDDIQNYFDVRFTECIRRGYEKEMYVEHDTAANVLRFGLVSGSSATQCNIFPIFDLIDWTWSFDTLGQAHTHVHEVEADTGQFAVLQIGAATNGYVYLLNDNSVKTDDGTNIDMDVKPEFNARSKHLEMSEVIVRALPVTDANLSFQLYEDGVEVTELAHTISLDDPTDGQNLIRERMLIDAHQASNITLRFRSNSDDDCYLYDFNAEIEEVQNR